MWYFVSRVLVSPQRDLTDAPLHCLGGPVADLGADVGVHLGVGGERAAVGGGRGLPQGG